ncbi:RIMS-binding protein 2 isoform X17 [Denticeps clupeoides]|uniref:RIMS-binding protein 2 isoform X17 n=1 Tax=Denticeps clupeoides TaxID=299321 RepID=UPI0010A2D015|nr:RIMS-binding protein 2 isoform X17 [Denticeps clupeoides]
MDMMRGDGVSEVELARKPKRDKLWIDRNCGLSVIADGKNGPRRSKKVKNEAGPSPLPDSPPRVVESLPALKQHRAIQLRRLSLKRIQQPQQAHTSQVRPQETEISKKRTQLELLDHEVQKRSPTCQTLENELHDVLEAKSHLSVQRFGNTQKAEQYEQVKANYEQLRETLRFVTKERDCAVLENTQLQAKLENLEQVLKHMRDAAERRQQLEVEHEQALAVLNAKQQEIDLLQKAQVEAKKEHEGAVHLLENHLDSMQAKVRELEEKCRTQSEQFNLLSKELEKFRLQAGSFDIISSSTLTVNEAPASPGKSLSQLLNGLAAPAGKGNDSPLSRSVVSEVIRPLQVSGEKGEFLSVKQSFLSRSQPSSPRRFLTEVRPFLTSQMDKELSPTPRSKPRYSGKVRLCVARYNYNPYDGPNENPEAELPLVAGRYLYVYGTMDEDGFYEGELLDGQQGLVPSNFVDFLQEDDVLSVPPSERSIKETAYLNHSPAPQSSVPGTGSTTLGSLLSESAKLDSLGAGSATSTLTSLSTLSSLSSLGTLGTVGNDLLGSCSNGMGTLDVSIDEVGEDIVPYPRRINLIKQLAKSVIVGWEPPVVPPGWGVVSAYNVLVDREVRMTVPLGGRTKALIEKLNLATTTHRISIQSVTERGLSDELRCTLLVGKDVVVAPYYLRVENITPVSAELSWMPSNSNYSHTIFLNESEYDVMKPGSYRYHFYNLKPMTVYMVRLVARPHQMPWQLPLEQREKREISVEFCTQHAETSLPGPPHPPQEVQVLIGQNPGVLQVRWKPPALTPSGTSNGASVIGYAVCTKGQKIAEVLYPTADYVTVELNRIQGLEAREVVVRTLSVQGESQDSPVATIPHSVLGAPPPHLHPQPHSVPLHTVPPYPQTYPPTHPQPHIQSMPHTLPHVQPHAHPPPPHPQTHVHLPHAHPLPKPKLLPSAREIHTKEQDGLRRPWDHPASPVPRAPSPLPPPGHSGRTLEPPHIQGRRSPSPQRILPQPQGTPMTNTAAKAMAREAAQRTAENSRVERRNIFSERGSALHSLNSDEEEDGYESPRSRRRGASVDEFLRGSELGRHHHYSHSEEYYTESSRGSDLSDILEEDEEELYSEMQLEEGRRRSINSHNTLKILGNSSALGRSDRMDHSRRRGHGCAPPQRRPMMVPSIEITMENNSEGSEGNLSPGKEDVYYGSVAGHRKRSPHRADQRYDGYGGRNRRSPDYYDESELEDLVRVFVALFDYDPLSMSPNPDAAVEELPFKEGQIIKVYGDKDTDGFYRADIGGRPGLIPCNMVSEIQTEDDDMIDQLLKQGFLPLNTPVEKIERNRRSGRQHPVSTCRMVALYDYDPRESSPNVDVEAELTFCAGDVITVFGEIDEDGFYYGELNGHRGLVPSNFLEEVPEDVEVYLTDTPSRYAQDHPARTKTKRKKSVHFTP